MLITRGTVGLFEGDSYIDSEKLPPLEEIMGKKTSNELIKHMAKALVFRWEFLRRNVRYQEECKSWLKLRKENHKSAETAWNKILDKYTYPPMNYEQDVKTIFVEHKKFFSDMEKLEQYKKQPYIKRYPYLYFLTWLFLLSLDHDEIVQIVDFSEDIMFDNKGRKLKYSGNPKRLKTINTMRVAINLTYPKEQILSHIVELIGIFKKQDSVKRKRFYEYDRYIKAYVRLSKEWNLREMAKKHYPGDVERDDLSYAKRKMKRDFDRGKEMVEGGYRKIR